MQTLNQYLQTALTKARGNKTQAKRALMEEAVQNPDLAQQLAIPFLESITGYALDHFIRKNPAATQVKAPINAPPASAEGSGQGSQKHKAAMEALIGAYKKKT
ncbi:MAG: hypothetical protein AB7G06_03490 [Bdellovibrionales bacterium]